MSFETMLVGKLAFVCGRWLRSVQIAVVKTGAPRQPRAGWGMAPPLRSTALEGELPFTLELTAED